MARKHHVTFNDRTFDASHGETLLDAALRNGVDLPYDCRAGHCGTCCVRLISGDVRGGKAAEAGIVHACQCRISGDAVIERIRMGEVRSIEGVLAGLRRLSAEVIEVGIRTSRALPYYAGQYVHVQFSGYPSRPYSLTLPLSRETGGDTVWFHVRRFKDGHVTSSLGQRIRPGHQVMLTGPYGSAYFRPNLKSRLILAATNTGFAPIWSIAVAALRENPSRRMMIIAGGRSFESLYMGAALEQLARFPNVLTLPVCSSLRDMAGTVMPGRPTDYLPRLLPSDVLYACGAPAMVETVKSVAARIGASCYADPFMPADRTLTGEAEPLPGSARCKAMRAGTVTRIFRGPGALKSFSWKPQRSRTQVGPQNALE